MAGASRPAHSYCLAGEAWSAEDLTATWTEAAGGRVVTLTARFLRASRCVAVLAAGERRRGALRRHDVRADGEHLGAEGDGVVRWYVDHAACQPMGGG